jgi:hypothetical protein
MRSFGKEASPFPRDKRLPETFNLTCLLDDILFRKEASRKDAKAQSKTQ